MFLLAACSTTATQQSDLLLGVFAGSDQKAAFVPPQHSRFPEGMEPAITVWLDESSAGKTAAGDTVSGFRFVSWREDEAVRVRVFALTNARGYTKSPSALKSVAVGDYTVATGDEIQVAQMSQFGVTPMTLRVSPYATRA